MLRSFLIGALVLLAACGGETGPDTDPDPPLYPAVAGNYTLSGTIDGMIRATVERMKALDPTIEPQVGAAPASATGGLVFLDVSYDQATATRLWQLSADLVGLPRPQTPVGSYNLGPRSKEHQL